MTQFLLASEQIYWHQKRFTDILDKATWKIKPQIPKNRFTKHEGYSDISEAATGGVLQEKRLKNFININLLPLIRLGNGERVRFDSPPVFFRKQFLQN